MHEAKLNGLLYQMEDPKSEMAQLIASKDWTDTPLGPIASWSESLASSVNLCLNSKLPIAIWWGDDLTKIYNESFGDLFQLNHSKAFGTKGSEGWSESWDDFASSLKGILETGTSHQTDIKFPLKKNHRELYHGTLHNTPLYDAAGEVRGILTIIIKSDQYPSINQQIEENEARLRMAADLTGLGTWDYNPLTEELTWSEKCREIYAIPGNQPIDFKTFYDHIYPEDRAFVESELRRSMDPLSGGSFNMTYRILRFGNREIRWIKTQGKVYYNNKKQAERFIGTVVDVTSNKEHEIHQRENMLKMQLTMQASAMGSFEWNMINAAFLYTDRLAQIFGFADTKNLTHKDFSDRIHPDDLEIRLKAHEEAFRNGTLFYEARVVWPDDSIHWVRFNGQIIFDARGNPERMYGTTLDVTDSKMQAVELERKVMERTRLLHRKNEELKMSEERYYKMTEEVQDYAIILLDKDGTILNWNKGAEKIKGYSEKEIIGRNFCIFYLDEDRQSNLPQKLIGEASNFGRAMHEGWRKRKDGSKFWGSIVITALHDSRNDVIGFTKVTRDLTERKLAEDIMRQHTAELEVKNKQLEQFAYIASHDLQEPLRKIQTFIHVLERKIDNPEARKKYFEKIKSSAIRMSELIQSVLNYSRLSKNDELWAATDLNTVFENVRGDYELMISEKNAIVKSDYLPTIKAIPLQMSQLFGNLIGNSLKFSSEQPVISVSANIVTDEEIQKTIPSLTNNKNYVQLTFKDNGIGFEQQYAEKIFTIFQRLNKREDYAGTGIGLALCKKIVDNHYGFIKAEGALGKGATFTIYLPTESNLKPVNLKPQT